VTQKIKATIDQKPQLGHNEMRHVNSLNMVLVRPTGSAVMRA